MILIEGKLPKFRHYSYDVGGEARISATPPTEPQAKNIVFIAEGTQIGEPINHAGKPVAVVLHYDNGGTMFGGTDGLPVDIVVLPGQKAAYREMIARELSD